MLSFVVPRLIWLALNPLNLLLLALCVALVLLLTRWRRAGQRLLLTCSVVLVVLAVLPVGRVMIAVLESRFPPTQQSPAGVDGIILLGGSVNLKRSEALGIPILNASLHISKRKLEAGPGRRKKGRVRLTVIQGQTP